jgi:hypothetical protein
MKQAKIPTGKVTNIDQEKVAINSQNNSDSFAFSLP